MKIAKLYVCVCVCVTESHPVRSKGTSKEVRSRKEGKAHIIVKEEEKCITYRCFKFVNIPVQTIQREHTRKAACPR